MDSSVKHYMIERWISEAPPLLGSAEALNYITAGLDDPYPLGS
jgi:hypothetical protein